MRYDSGAPAAHPEPEAHPNGYFDMCADFADFPDQLERYCVSEERHAPDEDSRFKTLTKERLGGIEEALMKIQDELRNLRSDMNKAMPGLGEPSKGNRRQSMGDRRSMSEQRTSMSSPDG